MDFWLILGSKIDEKSMKNRSKNRSKIRCDLGSIFDGSWVDFGVDLGAKLGPSWNQNQSKIEVEKSVQQRCDFEPKKLKNVKIFRRAGLS